MRGLIGTGFFLHLLFAVAPAQAERVTAEVAWDLEKGALSTRFVAPDYPPTLEARFELSGPSAKSISDLQVTNAEPGRKALLIGVDQMPAAAGTALAEQLQWEPLNEGWVARFSVYSPKAAALRLKLRFEDLPDAAILRFAGSAMAGIEAPAVSGTEYRRIANQDGFMWLPLTEGDRQTVELYVPEGDARAWVRPQLLAVSHLLVSPARAFDRSQLLPKGFGDSGSCNLDAKCFANPDQAFLTAKNAVAHMQFQVPQGGAVCTGTLLNDTDTSTQIPHFFSAAHCFTDQATANSLATFWFFETTACGSRVQDTAALRQVSGGAQIQFASAASDVLLVRLNGTPPAGAGYGGWDSALITAQTSTTVIHHPAGDAKKYSLATVTGLGSSSLASGQFIKVQYTTATTEGGSSGAGLLTRSGSNYFLRGGLLGGGASCANTGTNSPNNSDDFSRFDLAFPSLRAFLAPTTTGGGGPPAGTDFTGAWFNPAQNGWGLVILRGGSGAYAVYIYHYGDDSKPDWYLGAAALSGNRFQSTMSAFTGPWFGIVPFNAAAVNSRNAGSLTIDFTTATAANVTFTIDGRTVTTSLSKLSF